MVKFHRVCFIHIKVVTLRTYQVECDLLCTDNGSLEVVKGERVAFTGCVIWVKTKEQETWTVQVPILKHVRLFLSTTKTEVGTIRKVCGVSNRSANEQ